VTIRYSNVCTSLFTKCVEVMFSEVELPLYRVLGRSPPRSTVTFIITLIMANSLYSRSTVQPPFSIHRPEDVATKEQTTL
jgi:hypothetical protein